MKTKKPEGVTKDGSLWFGEQFQENNKWFFVVYDQNDNPFETDEIPERFPFMEITVFPKTADERFVAEYFLARKIGDARFGSECRHARAKRGYCPDCLRKVI